MYLDEGGILDDLVGGLGFGLHRILVPLIVTILLAARGGVLLARLDERGAIEVEEVIEKLKSGTHLLAVLSQTT